MNPPLIISDRQRESLDVRVIKSMSSKRIGRNDRVYNQRGVKFFPHARAAKKENEWSQKSIMLHSGREFQLVKGKSVNNITYRKKSPWICSI